MEVMVEEVIGRSVIEGAVAAAAVVKALEVIEQRGGGGATAGEGLTINEQFGLEGSEGAFGKSVVVAIALGAHALAQAGAFEQIACAGG